MKKLDISIVLISLAFMSAAVFAQWGQISSLHWSVRPGLMVLSTLALIGLFFLDAYGWHLILKAIGYTLEVKQSRMIWMVSSITRYVPGGVWAYASRVSLLKQNGVNVAAGTLSLYLETLLLTLSSLAVGIPALLAAAGLSISMLEIACSWVLLGLLLHPRIISMLHYLPGRIGKAFATIKIPSLTQIAALYAYYILFWVLFGIAFIGFVCSVFPVGYEHWVVTGSSVAMAFCIGFIIFFVPGGIGVRESALYVVLNTLLPGSTSLVVAIGSRLWIMLGEVISLGMALIWKGKNVSLRQECEIK